MKKNKLIEKEVLEEDNIEDVEDVEVIEEENLDNQSEMDKLLSENMALSVEVEKLVNQLIEEQNKFQMLEKNQMFEKIILQLGGRNTKAILALIDEDLSIIEEQDFIQAVKKIEKSDSYLFSVQEDKIGGTGFKNSKSTKKNIANAFKSGLGI